LWFIDSRNELSAMDLDSGALFTLAQLPRDASITALAVGATQVYAADGKNGRLFVLDTKTERWSARELPFLHGTVAMIVAPDGRLWLGMDDSAQAMSFDPRTNRIETVDTGLGGITALAIDNLARLWTIDGDHLLASYDLRNGRVTQVRLPGRGAARALLPDPTGSVWVGTTAGEVISVRDGTYDIVVGTGRPIAKLTLDPRGVAWYLTPSAAGQVGFTYAALDGRASRTIPGPAASLDFVLGGVAWIADPAGGFYVAPEASR
jgi:streptogramin lyase